MRKCLLMIVAAAVAVLFFGGQARGEDLLGKWTLALFGNGPEKTPAGEKKNLAGVLDPDKPNVPRRAVPEGFNFRLRLKGLGQIRMTAVENDKYLRETGDSSVYDSVNLERVWLQARMPEMGSGRGDGKERWGLWLIYDLGMDNSNLVDFWIWYKEVDYLNFQVGQMRLPFGWQMRTSPFDLATAKYGQVVKQLFPEPRDQGLRLCGDLFSKQFYYSAGAFNGDVERHGAVCVRLGWQPVNKMEPITKRDKGQRKIKKRIDLGISYYAGDYTSELNGEKVSRVRIGADFRYITRYTVFQGEFITNAPSTRLANGGEPKTTGYFIELGYFAIPREFRPTVRLDYLDVEGDPFGASTVLSFGFTYMYSKKDYLTFQFFYEMHLEEEKQPNLDKGSVLHNDQFIAQINIRF